MSAIIAPPSPAPAGLKEAIEAAGHWAVTEPDGWLVDDATAVQAIIAGYAGSASQLAYTQQQALAALAAQYASIIAEGRIFTLSSSTTAHTYQIDEVSPTPTRQSSLALIGQAGAWAGDVVNGTAGVAPWPSTFAWADASNNMVPMTAPQCFAFSQNVAAYVAATKANYFTLRGEIAAATSVSAVNSVNVAAGWPSNP